MSEPGEGLARPPSLFKYFAPERLDALDGWLRCSPAIVLNDVFEMTSNFTAWASEEELHTAVMEGWPAQLDKALDDEFRKAGLSREAVMALPAAKKLLETLVRPYADPTHILRPILDGLLPKLNEAVSEKIGTAVGVISLTEEPTNLLMWAHYADKHMGFVIEYAPEHGWFDRQRVPDDEFFRLRQVRYQRERAALIATQTSGEHMFLTKSADWEYEKEWRVLVPIDGCEIRGQDARHGVPVHVVPVPREAIRRVILGSRMTPDVRLAVVERANGLTIHEAVPRKDEYGLDVRPLRPSA